MKITKLGPTENFAALNPPDWLARDLNWLARSAPTFRLMVLFADDLPDASPEKRLGIIEDLHAQHFGGSGHPVRLDPGMASTRTGHATHNASDIRHQQTVCNSLTGHDLIRYHYQQPATAGIIILPARNTTAHEFTSKTANVPDSLCARLEDVSVPRMVLGHEYGHLTEYMSQPHLLRRRTSEKKADGFIHTLCASSGDTATSDFARNWRLLCNFTHPVDLVPGEFDEARPSDYWHDLASHGLNAPEVDEYSAACELKLRRLGLVAALPDNPQAFVRSMFDLAAQPRMQSVEMFRNLLEAHDNPYKYTHSEALACSVIRAATDLTPGVFR